MSILASDGGVYTFVYDPTAYIPALCSDLGNGARSTYAYDDGGRVTGLSNKKSDGTVISSFAYAYDSAGNRTGVTEASGDLVTWSYDVTYKLTRERRNGANALRNR